MGEAESKGNNIGRKMLAIMGEVSYIQKKGYNQSQKYTYATEADFAAEVRQQLIKHGVAFTPFLESVDTKEVTTKAGTVMQIVTVIMVFTFTDIESGESVSVRMGGQGSDTLDKGIFKAMTGAEKYALKQAFLVPTGDDPEVDNEAEKTGDMPVQKPVESEFVQADKWVNLLKIAVHAKEHPKLAEHGYATHKDIIADALVKAGYEATTRGGEVKTADYPAIETFVRNKTDAIVKSSIVSTTEVKE